MANSGLDRRERGAAIKRARAALSDLTLRDSLFRKCQADEITLDNVLETLRQKSKSHKRKKLTRCLDTLHGCTAWMLNIASSIDVVVNASAGIACPAWAPIKFLLLVSQYRTSICDSSNRATLRP